MADRARDVSAVLDALPGWFGTRADVADAGVLGHSRGTVTALAAAGGSAPPAAGSAVLRRPRAVLAAQRRPAHPGRDGDGHRQAAISLGVDFKAITVPTLLVSGALDAMSPPAVSRARASEIASADKQLRVDPQGGRTARFDSTYCDQMQAAGSIAAANPRAMLDRHTFDRIVTSPNSGWGTDYCSFASFAGIEALTTAGDRRFTATAANVPVTGLDTDAVKEQMVAAGRRLLRLAARARRERRRRRHGARDARAHARQRRRRSARSAGRGPQLRREHHGDRDVDGG